MVRGGEGVLEIGKAQEKVGRGRAVWPDNRSTADSANIEPRWCDNPICVTLLRPSRSRRGLSSSQGLEIGDQIGHALHVDRLLQILGHG